MILENSPPITTKRLILRKFTTDDLKHYLAIMSDKISNEFLPWFTIDNFVDASEYLHKLCLDTYLKPSGYRYAICLKEDNIPIGYCGMSDDASYDIGYGLRHEFWHKGIATEGVGAMINRIKNAGYPFITATHDVLNPHSGAVMKKLGMSYRYTYVEQWQPKNISVAFRMYQMDFDPNSQTYLEYWNKFANHYIEVIE